MVVVVMVVRLRSASFPTAGTWTVREHPGASVTCGCQRGCDRGARTATLSPSVAMALLSVVFSFVLFFVKHWCCACAVRVRVYACV